MKAFDADEGSAAEIRYSIYEKQSSEVTSIFSIDPKTGGLFLVRNATKWGKFNIITLKHSIRVSFHLMFL